MTREERNIKLKHLITCMKCEVSGKVCDDNCTTQYAAGNMCEIIENLEAISKLLEQEPILDKIMADIGSALSEEVLDDNRHLISDIGIGLEIALGIIDKYKAESGED